VPGHRLRDGARARLGERLGELLHPKVRAHAGRSTRGPLPIVVGTLVLVEVERLPRGERRREPRVMWLCGGTVLRGPRRSSKPALLALLRAALGHRAYTFRFLKQELGWSTPRVRHPEQADRWRWLVVAAYMQLLGWRAPRAWPSEGFRGRGVTTLVA
jgi:hypothetical protein